MNVISKVKARIRDEITAVEIRLVTSTDYASAVLSGKLLAYEEALRILDQVEHEEKLGVMK